MEKNCKSELISSLRHHVNPDRDGQLKKAKAEIDEKAARLIKLVKTMNRRKKGGGNTTNSEVVELIGDFHKQYLSLYELHEDLREDLIEKVRVREEANEVEEEGSFTTYNAEDSFFSADEMIIGSSPGHDHIRRGSDDFDLKLETPSAEILDLRNKLASISEEKEALKLECMSSLNKIQESEKIIEDLKIEAEQTVNEKQRLFDELTQMKEKIAVSDKELVSLGKEHEARVSEVTSRVEKLKGEISRVKLEEENLCKEKRELEERIEGKTIEAKILGEENLKLQTGIEELENMSEEKEDQLSDLMKKLEENESDSSLKINKLNQELSDSRNQTVDLKEMLENTAMDLQKAQEGKVNFERQVKDLDRKVDFIIGEKIEVKIQIEKKIKEVEQLRVDNEELQDRIFQLEKLEMKRGDELSAIQTKLEGIENDSSVKIKSSEEEVKKLQEKMKLNLKIIERKIEDTAEGFNKKVEDSIRILSRRIRVAEQLHMENKDIYMKTKEKYEKEQESYKDMTETSEVAVKSIRDISFTASVILDKSEAATIKFNEQSENFLNRILKASCKVLFAKDWVRRKKNVIQNFQEDADILLLEMGKKESEILGLRERVWKSENKVRELQKIVKEKDDGMLSVAEEKREAIRQLCVWIDYHRSRIDSLKKIFSEMTAARWQKIICFG